MLYVPIAPLKKNVIHKCDRKGIDKAHFSKSKLDQMMWSDIVLDRSSQEVPNDDDDDDKYSFL